MRVHGYAEIDRAEFWNFVDRGGGRFRHVLRPRPAESPRSCSPWKQLGRKWHFARKGFPIGKQVRWEPEVLEELDRVARRGRPRRPVAWNNKQVVPLYVPEQQEPWAAVQTKNSTAST